MDNELPSAGYFAGMVRQMLPEHLIGSKLLFGRVLRLVQVEQTLASVLTALVECILQAEHEVAQGCFLGANREAGVLLNGLIAFTTEHPEFCQGYVAACQEDTDKDGA